MKTRFTITCLLILALVTVVGTTVMAKVQEDIDKHRSCAACGMDRKAYGYSRMLIVFEAGDEVGICSLHCAAEQMQAHKDRPVKSLLAADRDTQMLIDAEKAVWVMGGKKRGVMTRMPKWSFADEAAARSFIEANGGKIVSWAEALAAAREETSGKMQ
jgi:copper chaperone NosL